MPCHPLWKAARFFQVPKCVSVCMYVCVPFTLPPAASLSLGVLLSFFFTLFDVVFFFLLILRRRSSVYSSGERFFFSLFLSLSPALLGRRQTGRQTETETAEGRQISKEPCAPRVELKVLNGVTLSKQSYSRKQR